MQTVDIILIIIITAFGVAGLILGFIHTLGSLLGAVLGVYLASRYYGLMADWLMGVTGWQGNAARVIMFIIAFIIISRLVGIVFFFIEKIFNILRFIPFVKSLNRLLGMVLGFAEGIITLGMIIFFVERFPLSVKLMSFLAGSIVAPYLSGVAFILWPFLPQAFQLLESTVDYVEWMVK